jgi:integrase
VALTSKRIARLLKRPGRHPDGHGLYLLVPEPRGHRPPAASWGVRYQRHGVEHLLGLGALHVVGLREARKRASAARLLLLDGVDPIEQKKKLKQQNLIAAAKAMTFADAAEKYFGQQQGKYRNDKHRRQVLDSLQRFAFPIIGKLPIATIDTPLVLQVLEQRIADEGPFNEVRAPTAARVRGRIEAVIDWAKARGLRSGDNPAAWEVISKVLSSPATKLANHHAALAYAELPKFMTALTATPGTSARALEFLILTTARSGEVFKAAWSEIDFNERIWTIPAARMKALKEHRVPLSDRAIELLRDLPREEGNEFIFIGAQQGRGLSHFSLTRVLERLRRADVTVHGFRSTFRTWAAERTAFPREVCEASLAHNIGTAVERAYQRTTLFDHRRRLMAEWASYCYSPPVEGKVMPLRGRS